MGFEASDLDGMYMSKAWWLKLPALGLKPRWVAQELLRQRQRQLQQQHQRWRRRQTDLQPWQLQQQQGWLQRNVITGHEDAQERRRRGRSRGGLQRTSNGLGGIDVSRNVSLSYLERLQSPTLDCCIDQNI